VGDVQIDRLEIVDDEIHLDVVVEGQNFVVVMVVIVVVAAPSDEEVG